VSIDAFAIGIELAHCHPLYPVQPGRGVKHSCPHQRLAKSTHHFLSSSSHLLGTNGTSSSLSSLQALVSIAEHNTCSVLEVLYVSRLCKDVRAAPVSKCVTLVDMHPETIPCVPMHEHADDRRHACSCSIFCTTITQASEPSSWRTVTKP
jgi:hypothetical protein